MKKRILVVMGGRSSEHDVSLASGKQVVANLDTKKYDVLPIVISSDGRRWISKTREELLRLDTTLKEKPSAKSIINLKETGAFDIQNFDTNSIDTIAFIALHGKYGEDGTIQGLFELMGIKYTGAGVLASSIGMNKLKFRHLLSHKKIRIPKYVVVNKNYNLKDIESHLTFPMFIKPNEAGSSIGASLARNEDELVKSIKNAFKYDDVVLVDEYLPGKELTCAVIGNTNPIALPIVEIRPLKANFFDYNSKYTESGSEEIVPAEIPEDIKIKIENIALEVYKEVGCVGFGRIDFILVGKTPYVLEINTIPGLTPASLLPKAAAAAGISFPRLLDRIIKFASESRD